MKKLLITTAVLFTALPFSFDGVTPTVSKAQARIGHPLTPFSVAGVHRRAMRRTYGVGANLGYHPVARAALYGAAASGAGYYGAGYGGWGGGWGWNNRPGYGFGMGYAPSYGYAGYGYPAYGYGYGSGYYGGYRSAYHPVIRRHIYARAVGVGRHWR